MIINASKSEESTCSLSEIRVQMSYRVGKTRLWDSMGACLILRKSINYQVIFFGCCCLSLFLYKYIYIYIYRGTEPEIHVQISYRVGKIRLWDSMGACLILRKSINYQVIFFGCCCHSLFLSIYIYIYIYRDRARTWN